MIWTTILATLLKLHLWSPDVTQENPAERAERLQVASVAIAAAASSRDETAFLLAEGEAETRFAKYVGEDRCQDGPAGVRCDHGTARGYWQAHRAACPALFELPDGDERAVAVAAQCSIALFRYARFACSAPEGVFNLPAGRRCSDPWGRARLKRMAEIRAMLDRSAVQHSASPAATP